MKRIATATIAASIVLAAGAAAARKGPAGPRPDDQVPELRHQIAAKLLFDGLKLTPDQKTKLAAKLAEVDAEHDARVASKDGKRADLEAVLRTARDEVYQTGTITAATRERLQQIHREGKEQKAGDAKGKPGKELEGILTPEQLAYLKRFDPKHELGLGPERGGRGDKGGKGLGVEHVAERVRAMSEDEFQQHKQKMLEKSRTRMAERGIADVETKVTELGRQIDTLRTGTPAELAALEADHALPIMLGQHAHKGFRARQHREERKERMKVMLSPEFRAMLEGKDPLKQ